MNRRTVAGLLAVGLLVVLVAAAWSRPVDYVTFRPGPTMDVLGKYDGKRIVDVSGRKTYRDDGAIRMVTVYAGGPDQKINLINMVWAWANPDVAVLPRSIYQEGETDASNRQESAVEMASSQDSATAAALSALDIGYRTEVKVGDVAEDGASAGILRKGDVLLAVNGTKTPDTQRLVEAIRPIAPGTRTALTIRRDGAERTVQITTKPAPDDPKASRIGVTIGVDYTFPFEVDIKLPDTVGGPSAGLVFALAIYDVLTPGSLTGGKQVAGSGEISAEGVIGPIGGISQKLVAAQRDGAKLFLVAQENCAEAVHSHYDPGKMRLVKVHTLSEAIKDLEAWKQGRGESLPRCAG